MCLAQGRNAATQVRLEPVTPQSRDKHSITEPFGSPFLEKSVKRKKEIQFLLQRSPPLVSFTS